MQLRHFLASALVVFFLLTSITPEIASLGSQETPHVRSYKEYDGMRKMYVQTGRVERGLRTKSPWYTQPQSPVPQKGRQQYVPPPPI